MILISGFLGLGTDIVGNRPTEVRGRSYSRPLVTIAGHPTFDCLSSMSGIDAPAHGLIRIAAIYDSPKQGRVLTWWRMPPPLIEIGHTGLPYWPGADLSVVPDFRIQLAVNAARAGRATDLIITEASTFGTVNGQPLVAGCRLTIEADSGRLVSTASVAKVAEVARRTA